MKFVWWMRACICQRLPALRALFLSFASTLLASFNAFGADTTFVLPLRARLGYMLTNGTKTAVKRKSPIHVGHADIALTG